MAKKLIYNYQFIPGAANAGVVKVPGNHPQRVFLLVTNTTRSTIIYNFAGAGTGGSTSYDQADDETTLTLEFDTSTHNTNDELQIFLDIREDKIDFSESFVDPVNKLRVSNPENLIDTDFEYGLQASKWETVELVDNIPSTYTRAASVSIGEIQQVNTIQNDDIITVRTGIPHDLSTGDPIEVQGTGSRTANGKYLVLGVSSTTEFSYRAGDVQNSTGNIVEAYTTIIPGSFFASSDIDYVETNGIATNEASPESTLTFTTDYVHGLSENTSIYVTNTVGKKEFEITNTTANAQDGSPNINTADSTFFLKQHNLVNNQRIYVSPGTGGTLPTPAVGAPLAQGESNCQAVFDSVNTACEAIRTTAAGAMTSIYTRYSNTNYAAYVYGGYGISPTDVGGYGGGTDYQFQQMRYGDDSDGNYFMIDVKTQGGSYRGGYYWYPFGEGYATLYTGKAVDVGAFYNANTTALNNGLPTNMTGKAWKTYTKHTDNSFQPFLVKVHQVDTDFTSVNSSYNRTYLFDSSYRSKTVLTNFYNSRTSRTSQNSPISAGNGWYYTYASVWQYGGYSNRPGFLELDITLFNTGWGTLANNVNSNWYQRTWSYSAYSFNSRDSNNFAGMHYKIETFFMTDDSEGGVSFGPTGTNQTTAQMAATIVNQVIADRSYASWPNSSGQNEVRAKVVNGDRITLEDTSQRPFVFSSSGTGPIDVETDQTAGVFDDYYKLSSVTSNTASINAGSKVPARVLEFTNTSNSDIIDDGNGVYYFRETTGHGIKSGSPIVFSVTSGAAVPGLTSGSTYYAYVADDQHFFPCASISDWQSAVNAITAQPSSNGVYEVKIPTIDGRVAAGGTIAITEGSAKVTGTDTAFSSAYKIGDTFAYTTTGSTVNSFVESRVVSVINDTELTLDSARTETRSGLNHYVNTKINIRADGQFLHRPFDGGVEITAGKSPDSTIVRQTRKYFRYQSGKGIQCSVAINFNPARPLKSIAGSGSTVTATTEYPHGLTVGNYVLIQGVEEQKSLTPTGATYNPTTGDLVLTINGHGINTDEEISIAEGGITFTCAKDGHATNHPYPRSSDPAGGNTRLRVLYSDTNTIKVNVGTSSDTTTHTFVSATTNGVTHYDITNPYNGTNYEVATVPDAFTFTYSASGSVTVASPTGIPEYAIARYKNAGVRCGLFDFQNGFFFEYDGKQLYAVRRSSVQQLSGTVSAVYGRNVITGDGSTFTKDLVAGDYIVLRGQSYKVTSVVSDKILNIQPKYQGLTTIGAVLTKTVDVKVPQSQWNIDKADGTGPSAFNLDIHKIQMVYLDYSWYGAGKIRFGFKDTYGHVKYMHEFIHNNRINEAYMRSGNIPGRYEVFNKAVPDFVPSLFHWGTSVIMDGTFDDDDSYLFTAAGNALSFANGDVSTATTNAASLLTNTGWGRYRTYYVRLQFPSSDASKFSTGTPLYTAGGELDGETVAYTQYSGSNILVYIKISEGYSAPAVYPEVASGTVVSIGGPSTGGVNVDLNDLIPLISVRLAPSVDNNIIGALGERDIINRMQLKLKELGVSVTHDTTISVLLNANNSNLTYSDVGTPSLSQYIAHEAGDTVNGGVLVYQFRATGGTVNADGKRLSISSAFDLRELVDLGNSILGGDDVFPNGPDVMTICANVIDTAEVDSTSPFRVSSRLSWSESQA